MKTFLVYKKLKVKPPWFFCVKYLCLHVCVCVDIVEGMVNKGIFLDGDNGGTFLHFGSYQNSCISDPTLCGPEGEWAVVVQMITILLLFGSDSPSLRRDYLLLFLEKPRDGVSFCCSFWGEGYLQWLLRLHQSLQRIRGVLYSGQQPQMEGQHQSSRWTCLETCVTVIKQSFVLKLLLWLFTQGNSFKCCYVLKFPLISHVWPESDASSWSDIRCGVWAHSLGETLTCLWANKWVHIQQHIWFRFQNVTHMLLLFSVLSHSCCLLGLKSEFL